MTHHLEADSIQLIFGSRSILSDIHIRCDTGSITGLLGRNGQGKSCLFRILFGDLPIESRSVRVDGHSILPGSLRPDLLMYLPQFNFIPGRLTIARVIDDYQLEYGELEKRFPEFGGKAHRSKIRQLSGGQRRLINLYIILKSPAFFVLLDEPYTHLMPLQIEKVKEMLLEEKKRKGLLVTDHLFRHILDISDRFYVLADGKTHLARTEADIERLGYARL